MQLAAYLAQPDVRPDDFAARVGISTASLSRIAGGTQNTTIEVLRRIHAESGGHVTPNEVVGIDSFAPSASESGIIHKISAPQQECQA